MRLFYIFFLIKTFIGTTVLNSLDPPSCLIVVVYDSGCVCCTTLSITHEFHRCILSRVRIVFGLCKNYFFYYKTIFFLFKKKTMFFLKTRVAVSESFVNYELSSTLL
jgi:hypothetical protein